MGKSPHEALALLQAAAAAGVELARIDYRAYISEIAGSLPS